MFPKISPTETTAWRLLKEHFENDMRSSHMRVLFQNDAERFNKFSLKTDDILFDYSKNIINGKTMQLLLQLADECKVKLAMDAMFSGEKINQTEGRSVLHVALRNFSGNPIYSDGNDVMPDVMRVSGPHEKFLRKNSQRRMAGIYRQRNKIHCEHWHRRKRPWPGDGDGSIETLLDKKHAAIFCFKCRWDTYRRNTEKNYT